MRHDPVLTKADQDDINDLLGVLAENPEGFDRDVFAYVTNPDRDDQALFRSVWLAEHTSDALDRLIARAFDRLNRVRDQREKARQRRVVKLLTAERETLRPLVNQARSHAATHTPRHRAALIVGKAYYQDLRDVVRDLESGMSEKEAAAALRERIAQRR
jgi:hypothetical protein